MTADHYLKAFKEYRASGYGETESEAMAREALKERPVTWECEACCGRGSIRRPGVL